MSYRVEILRRAAKSLAKLPERDYERVRDAVRALGTDPRPPGCKKLVGREGWRIRIGRYRVIYEIADVVRVVTVLDVGHRKDIYE
ncbi:MAG: type II toxin-antitoxin system RelE/ParE family toxin [Bacteroidota bacterium]